MFRPNLRLAQISSNLHTYTLRATRAPIKIKHDVHDTNLLLQLSTMTLLRDIHTLVFMYYVPLPNLGCVPLARPHVLQYVCILIRKTRGDSIQTGERRRKRTI